MLNLEMLLQMFEGCGPSVFNSTKMIVDCLAPTNVRCKKTSSFVNMQNRMFYTCKDPYFLLVLNQDFGLVCNLISVML